MELTLSDHDVSDIEHWILKQGLKEKPLSEVLIGFCERLQNRGFPVIRLSIGMNSLHPIYQGFGYTWTAGDETLVEDTFLRSSVGGEVNSDYLRSPFYRMMTERLMEYRQLLTGPVEREFEIYDYFRRLGATDYFVRVMSFRGIEGADQVFNFSSEQGMVFSWLGNRPGGWREADLNIIRRLVFSFALVAKVRASELTALSVAETYLGPDAGRRVMAGTIDRGSVETISAVIFFADLRGFTRLADQLSGDELVTLLDDYFEAITQPLVDAGGQVLKFMGDGLLAVFEIDTDENSALCQRALSATQETVASIARLNRGRQQAGQPTLALDIALHVGDVLYGNVGAVGRLDFTIVGPAVNEASRWIEI